MIRAAVAEDSLLVREGIVRILDEAEGIEVVGSAGSADALLALVDRARPDAVVTDIRMPPTHTDEGIRLAASSRRSHPDVAVVVLSQHAEPSYALALFEPGSGRRGYLLKQRLGEPGELVRALETVTAGGSLVDPGVIQDLLSANVQHERPTLAALTPRSREILALIAEGAQQQRDRGAARDHEAGRRAARQRDLPEARPRGLGRRQPPGQGRARLPRRDRRLAPGGPFIRTGRCEAAPRAASCGRSEARPHPEPPAPGGRSR